MVGVLTILAIRGVSTIPAIRKVSTILANHRYCPQYNTFPILRFFLLSDIGYALTSSQFLFFSIKSHCSIVLSENLRNHVFKNNYYLVEKCIFLNYKSGKNCTLLQVFF